MLKFGPYVVDLAAGELQKNGSRIRLQEKPLRVLVLLAERQGQLVTREELKNRLWPEETFVDFEAGLNTAVSKLRDALSDRADKPRYIETIPRRGYRFLTPVEIVGSSRNSTGLLASSAPPGEFPSTAETIPAPVAPSRPVDETLASESLTGRPSVEASKQPSMEDQIARIRSTHSLWIRATIAVAALILLFTVWWLTPLPDPRVTDIFRVTQSGRLDYLVRPATDRVRIFYVQRAGDHYDLMQAPVNGGEAQKIDPPFPNTLVWDVSRDRSRYLITSFARRGEPAPLWSWPTTGGIPVKIGDIVSGSAAFSPDGRQIAYHIGNDLLIAQVDGSRVRKLASFPAQPDSPVWSPDGSSIRFVLIDPQRNTSSIWEISPDGRNLHRVLPDWQGLPKQYCPTWTPDGRYFIFVDGSQSVSRLYTLREKQDWWRRSPRGPFLFAAETTGSWSPLVGLDGRSVYFYGTNFQSDLATLDLSTQHFSGVLREQRSAMLSVSRDGQWVTYISRVSRGIWASHFDGSAARQIELENMEGAFPRFSPDNKLIAFTGLRPGMPDAVYIAPSSGGALRSVGQNSDRTSDPDWSPDGSRLVVDRSAADRSVAASPQQPGSTLAVLDLATSAVTDLPGSENLRMPRWSPDGRHIAALSDTRTEIRMFDTASHRWSTLAQGKSLGFPVWSADGASLYYQDVLAPGEPLYRLQIANGSRTLVASFQSALDNGISRCVFVALTPEGIPLIAQDRNHSDIYGARLLLP